MDIEAALRFFPEKNNLSVEEMQVRMEKIIDAAKNDDSFKATFGEQVPSPEEFIQGVLMMLKTPDGTMQ